MELEVYKKSDFYEDYISSRKEYYERENADAYFAERLAEKDDEIAELKSEIRRKEAVEQRWFERCMEARSEAIRLKRALWLARAERAKTEHLSKIMYSTLFRDFIEKWVNVERKCRAKAEEYK